MIICIGLDANTLELIESQFKDQEFFKVSDSAQFEALLEQPPKDKKIMVVIAGHEIEGIDPTEIAQGTKMSISNVPCVYISKNQENFDPASFKKNGFDEAYLLPFDKDVLIELLREIISQTTGEVVYRSVQLLDVEPDMKLGFDLHLFFPMNKKYVKYVDSDDSISKEQFERLGKHHVSSAYIDNKDMDKFYEFSANRLAKLTEGNPNMSETERKERLRNSVRGIFSQVFSTDKESSSLTEGKKVVQEAQNIISAYISNTPGKDTFEKVQRQIGQQTESYSHNTNVSIYASLFSMATGIGKAEELSVAGLLHDLGESQIPDEILAKEHAHMDSGEKVIYEEHPSHSISIIKEKKLIVPENMQKAIKQHHERWMGQGFPDGAQGKSFKPESQILAIADEFDYMTRSIAGKKRYQPKEAIQLMIEKNLFDPEILKKVLQVMPEPAEEQK